MKVKIIKIDGDNVNDFVVHIHVLDDNEILEQVLDSEAQKDHDENINFEKNFKEGMIMVKNFVKVIEDSIIYLILGDYYF